MQARLHQEVPLLIATIRVANHMVAKAANLPLAEAMPKVLPLVAITLGAVAVSLCEQQEDHPGYFSVHTYPERSPLGQSGQPVLVLQPHEAGVLRSGKLLSFRRDPRTGHVGQPALETTPLHTVLAVGVAFPGSVPGALVVGFAAPEAVPVGVGEALPVYAQVLAGLVERERTLSLLHSHQRSLELQQRATRLAANWPDRAGNAFAELFALELGGRPATVWLSTPDHPSSALQLFGLYGYSAQEQQYLTGTHLERDNLQLGQAALSRGGVALLWTGDTARMSALEQDWVAAADARILICCGFHLPNGTAGLVYGTGPGPELSPLAAGNAASIVHTLMTGVERQTLRQNAEQAAAELRQTLDVSQDIIITIAAGGRIVSVNQATVRILGYAQDELLGTEFGALVHPDDRGQMQQAMAALTHDHTLTNLTVRMLRQDGAVAWLEWNAAQLTSDGLTWGVGRDVTARIQAETTIRRRLDLERTLAGISSGFVGATDVDMAIDAALAQIGHVCGSVRAYVFLFSDDGTTMDNTHEWCGPGISSQRAKLRNLPGDEFPWWMEKLRQGEVVHIPDVARLPAAAAAEQAILRMQGITSALALPLHVGGQLAGFLGCDNLPEGADWSEDDLVLLRTSAEIIGHALERARAQRALQVSEHKYRELFQGASDAVFLYTLTAARQPGRFLEVNDAAARLLGYGRGELLHMSYLDIIDPSCLTGETGLTEATLTQDHTQLEMSYVAREARIIPVEASTRALVLEGAEVVLVVARDVSERKALAAQLAHQAFHDGLTGLANRALFMDRLAHALPRACRRREHCAVLFLDLDSFKLINDSLGHQIGDQLLVAVAQRLLGCVRTEDTVARLGGDEFTVLLEDITEIADATMVAERIAARFQEPFSLGGKELFVSASIGIAMSSAEQQQPEEDLLRNADVAMYAAKKQGKAQFRVFAPSMHDATLTRLELETDLRRAIERGEMKVYYQPVVNLETGVICEMEALVRWEHPRRGILLPASFIPVAEENGLILPLGRWVLAEACRQARAWQAHSSAGSPLVVNVNFSARQFQQPDLVQTVSEVLQDTGLPPDSLQLELTEIVLSQDEQASLEKLRALKALGVRLAIDDFGTGFSSLSYLKRLPADAIKIDRSFITGPGAAAEDSAIVEAVIAFARALRLTVTSEGVETEAQLAHLRTLGCHRGQGFHFSPPLPGPKAAALLAAHPAWAPRSRPVMFLVPPGSGHRQ